MSAVDPETKLDAWKAFLKVHARVVDALERELRAERGLPLTWYDVLVQLEAAGGKLRMHDLARAVLLSRAGLTRLVDRMAEAGLVDRAPCEDDRRGTFVILTPRGGDSLREAAPGHLRGIEGHFTRFLSDDEAVAMKTALERIAAQL